MRTKEETTLKSTDTTQKSVITKVIEITLPAVLSLIAIIISLFIAHNQNKISLFEKRYEIYQTFKSLSVNAQSANQVFSSTEIDVNSIETWIAYVSHIIPNNTILDMAVFQLDTNVKKEDALEVYLQISNEIGACCIQIESSKYLFNLSESTKQELDRILSSFKSITYEGVLSDPNNLGKKMIQLTELLANFSGIDSMESQLKI